VQQCEYDVGDDNEDDADCVGPHQHQLILCALGTGGIGAPI